MQIQHVGYRIKGFYRAACLGHLWEMTSKHAQQRLNILGFFAEHGAAATCDAFDVSRRTLYRWKQALRQAGGDRAALTAKSCAPKRRRQPQAPPALVRQIRWLREKFPNLGKDKLQVLLRPWCRQQDIALPSVSTIGRIIARDPNKMRHAPTRLDARGRHKLIPRKRKTRKPKGFKHQPLEVFACDTVVRLRDGLRRYLFTFIDPHSRFAIAFAAATQSSQQAAIALDALCQLLPKPPRFILSDNGSEFMGRFQQRLDDHGMTHWWTYPRSPKMNAHAERFNRTVQEQFVDYHEDLLFTDLAAFNRKLADWLVDYNTVLPHHSLGLQSPVNFLIHNQPECQRWWTYTMGCFFLI